MKYYQKSLAALSSTLTSSEKENVTKNFFNEHQYLSTIWLYLPPNTQKKC